MSKKINSVACPKCHEQLMRMVSGTNGYIFIRCINCGSSVKIRASKDRRHERNCERRALKERNTVLKRIIEYSYRMTLFGSRLP